MNRVIPVMGVKSIVLEGGFGTRTLRIHGNTTVTFTDRIAKEQIVGSTTGSNPFFDNFEEGGIQ